MRGERSRKAREANERRSREEAEARRRRERAAARANTASAGGRTKTWETAQPGKKKTANDYYEEKRKKREKDRKEIDAAFNKAMEETQKMLRERDLGLIDHLDRSTGDTVYNQNYYDLFGMPEGGKDFNRRVERTRNWDKLTDSGKYDRMVYIQEEQERRRKGIPESTGMVYNKGDAGRGSARTWENGAWTQEGRGPEGNEDAVWSGPYRIGKPEGISEQEWLAMDAKGRLRAVHKGEGRKARDAWNAGERKPQEGSADTKGYDAWEALAEAAGKMGTDEGTLREYLAGNPGITLPNGLNAEKIQLSDVRQTNAAVQAKADGTEEVPLFFQGGMDELREYLREHPDVTLPNGMDAQTLQKFKEKYIDETKNEEELNQLEPWETVRTETESNASFDIAKGLANLSLEGIDTSNISVNMGGSTYHPSMSGKGAIAELFLNTVGFFANSYDTDDVKTEEQVKNPGTENEERRTVTQVGSLSDRRTKARYEPGVEYSLTDASYNPNSGKGVGTAASEVIAKGLFQKITGEEPTPGKTYDVKVVFSKEYLDDPYMGSYIKDSNGNTTFMPHTQGVQIILTESDWFSKPNKIDITGSFSKNVK